MREIKKYIDYKLQITHPNVLYNGDIEGIVMDMLKQKFEGKCYMSCLIIKIDKIIQISNLLCYNHSQDGSITCNVNFKVKAIVIKEFDILFNCKVERIDKNGIIICSHKNAAMSMNPNKQLQTIKEGQIIVTRAQAIKYNIFKPSISIRALPFIPVVKKDKMFKVKFSKSNTVEDMLKILKEKMIINHDMEVNDFFVELLYPFKEKRQMKKYEVKSLFDINKLKGTVIISQPDWLPKEEPTFITHKETRLNNVVNSEQLMTSDGTMVLEESFETIACYMIQTYIEYLDTIKNLCSNYKTMEDVKKNNNLWDIYRNNRR